MKQISYDQMERGLEAIEKLIEDKTKMAVANYGFIAIKHDMSLYHVDTSESTCDCPSHAECKHLRAARVLKALLI